MTTHETTSAQGPGIGWFRLWLPKIGELGVGKRRAMCDGKNKYRNMIREHPKVSPEVTSQLHTDVGFAHRPTKEVTINVYFGDWGRSSGSG